MKRFIVAAVCLTLVGGAVYAHKLNKEQKRLEESGVVMQEVLNVPENIPHELLEKAECVIVIPSVKKLAFGIGADYGRGAMVCRTGEKFRGPWGAPAMYALEGGSDLLSPKENRQAGRNRATGTHFFSGSDSH